MPFFSVIIPVYNRATVAAEAIQSVLAQDESDFEIIVVDDGSTDGSVESLRKFGESIQLIQQANAGPGAARNTGIAAAQGEYVAFLDSDDLWFSWTLRLYRETIDRCGRPAFITGAPLNIKRGESVPNIPASTIHLKESSDFYALEGVPFFTFTTSSVALRRDALNAAGGFSPLRINYEDLDLWMKLGTAGKYVMIESPPVAVRRFLGDNLSDQRSPNVAGALHMVESEKSGKYPGGHARRRDRRRLLEALIRAASVEFARRGEIRSALHLYRATLGWNCRSGRLRYLAGLPLIAGKGWLHHR